MTWKNTKFTKLFGGVSVNVTSFRFLKWDHFILIITVKMSDLLLASGQKWTKNSNDVNNQRFFKWCHNQNQKVQSANQFTANVCISVSRQEILLSEMADREYSSSLCEKRERECVSFKSIVSESIKLLVSLSTLVCVFWHCDIFPPCLSL